MEELTRIEQRWSDGVRLAGSTARIALSAQVANLQSIRRDLDAVSVSQCLGEAKGALKEHMDLTVEGFLDFMGDREVSSKLAFEEADKKLDAYKQARDKCVK